MTEPNFCALHKETMTPSEYRTLYQLLRRYQLESCKIGGKTYNAVDTILRELFPYYYNQNQEQGR
jgi:hypothetical protein